MKLILKFFLAFLFAGVVALVGCGGSDNDDKRVVTPAPTPTPTPTPAVQNLAEFQAANQKVKTETFDAGDGKDIVLASGVKVIIPPSAFLLNGDPVTGNVTVTIQEFMNQSDIVFAGLNTHLRNGSGGGLLQSLGFFKINATLEDGTALDPELNARITFKLETDDEENTVSVYLGGEDDGEFAWEQDPSNTTVVCVDPVSQLAYADGICRPKDELDTWWFSMEVSELGWYNYDILWKQSATKGDLTVTLQNVTAKSENVLVYFLSTENNVAVNLYPNQDGEYTSNLIPDATVGKVIALAVEDGKFYYQEKSVSASDWVDEELSIPLNLEELSREDLEAKIKALKD